MRRKRLKNRKRPRSWHRSTNSEHMYSDAVESLPKSDAKPEKWGEPVELHRKSQHPKKKR